MRQMVRTVTDVCEGVLGDWRILISNPRPEMEPRCSGFPLNGRRSPVANPVSSTNCITRSAVRPGRRAAARYPDRARGAVGPAVIATEPARFWGRRQDVDRQPDAARAEPAAGGLVGETRTRAISRSLSNDGRPCVTGLYRAQSQHVRPLAHRHVRPRWIRAEDPRLRAGAAASGARRESAAPRQLQPRTRVAMIVPSLNRERMRLAREER